MILFIDDDKYHLKYYIEMLALSGYETKIIDDIEIGLSWLDVYFSKIDLLVLDIMMPFNSNIKIPDYNDGLRTGVYIYDNIRQKFPELPIIILTNLHNDDVEIKFSNEHFCKFCHKDDFYPYELVEKINIFLSEVGALSKDNNGSLINE